MNHSHHQRHEARRIVLQALCQADVQGGEFMTGLLSHFLAQAGAEGGVGETAGAMARGAWEYHAAADQWIVRLAPQWGLSRLAVVDRNVLRLALWELTQQPDIPPRVVLDEAITMAREFSTEESARFVNGVLDAALKEKERISL